MLESGIIITLTFQSLFFRFPRLFRFVVFLFFVLSCSLSQGFQGFCGEENPFFFQGILAFCQKGKDWRGREGAYPTGGCRKTSFVDACQTQQCVRGTCSGFFVIYSRQYKQGALTLIKTGLDTSQIRINARLRCV